MSEKLIAFYSRADENYFNGTLRVLTVGNTEVAAGIIQELTGVDLFKIEQKILIPKDAMTVLRRPRPIRKETHALN